MSATDRDSNTAAQLVLRVERSAAAAQAGLPANSGVSIGFDGNRLVLRGPVSDIGQALEANATARTFSSLPPLDQTRLAGVQQVTLRVRIAEVSRTSLNQLGVNFNVLAKPGSFVLSLVTGGFVGSNSTSIIGSSGASPTGIGSSFGAVGAGVTTSNVNAEALINALQSEGVLTLLAEPTLTTISGETANFLAGGEIPVPVPQALGVTTIDYKQYGVRLAFTPTLLPGDRIALRVAPEVSEISQATGVTIAGATVPGFITRKANSIVEMASGQTLAIAGLLQRTDQNTLNRFPLLGDTPVLGALFRSSQFQRDESELVILITPFLTQPVSPPDAIPLPTDPFGTGPTAGRMVRVGGFAVE